MNQITGALKFSQHWGDEPSLDRIKASDKGHEWHKMEAENSLKGMAMRFERSPNINTIQIWAKDLVARGHKADQIEAVCKSIPFKFERHPTLSQIVELLRPYLTDDSFSVDDLDRYTHLCFPHLKSKFIKLTNDDALNKMCQYYLKEVCSVKNPDGNVFMLGMFNKYYQEMCVLNDWLRTYFSSDPKKVIDQGIISNQKAYDGDRDYFLRPLERYAKENKLV